MKKEHVFTLTATIDQSGWNISVTNADGSEVNIAEWTLFKALVEHYRPVMSFLYLARDTGRTPYYKIGVSKDPQRRAREFKGVIVHLIPYLHARVFKVEADVHETLNYMRLSAGREWFSNGAGTVNADWADVFKTLKSEADVKQWVRDMWLILRERELKGAS